MGRYMYYLSSTLVKKKGIWIAIVIGMAAVFAMTYFQIKDANEHHAKPISKIDNWATFDFFLPFIFGSLISTLFIIHAFKSGEQDGTELLVVAKPLTRSQIIFGKFFVTIIAQILYQILLLPLYSVLSFTDIVATNSQRIKYILSFSIGGLIIQFFMIGLITIFASMVGRIGTIVISILFASIIPIASFIVSFTTNSSLPNKNSINLHTYYLVKSIDKDDKNNIKKVGLIYEDNDKKEFDKMELKYKKVAYFDPWYQWSRFFTLFIDKSKDVKNLSGIIKYYKKTSPKFTKDDFKFKMELKDQNNKSHYFIPYEVSYDDEYYDHNESEFIKNSLVISDNQISDTADDFYNNLIATPNPNLETKEFNGKIINLNNFKELSAFNRTQVISNFIYNNKNFDDNDSRSVINKIRILNDLYLKHPDLQKWNNITSSKKDKESSYDNNSLTSLEDLNSSIIPITQEYLETSVVIIIWVLISFILIGLSIGIYFKRDFK